MPRKGYTSRGGKKNQDKNWQRFLLAHQTRFMHAGSAPLQSEGGTGLSLAYAKEDIKVHGYPRAPRKYMLAFPCVDYPPGIDLPEMMALTKAQKVLWSFDEMPHLFIFTLDAGTEVWSQDGRISENQEVGMPFDVTWDFSLVGEYRRINTTQAELMP